MGIAQRFPQLPQAALPTRSTPSIARRRFRDSLVASLSQVRARGYHPGPSGVIAVTMFPSPFMPRIATFVQWLGGGCRGDAGKLSPLQLCALRPADPDLPAMRPRQHLLRPPLPGSEAPTERPPGRGALSEDTRRGIAACGAAGSLARTQQAKSDASGIPARRACCHRSGTHDTGELPADISRAGG